MQHKEYNGWANYETWCVNLWMDNSEGDQEYWKDIAEDLQSDADDTDDLINRLADAIKEWHEDNDPTGNSGVYADLMGAALSEVNWRDIAEHIVEDNDLQIIEETEEEDGDTETE